MIEDIQLYLDCSETLKKYDIKVTITNRGEGWIIAISGHRAGALYLDTVEELSAFTEGAEAGYEYCKKLKGAGVEL